MTELNGQSPEIIIKAEPVNAQYRVEISDDHLRAYVTVIEPENGGEEITLPNLYAALKDAGVIVGLKDQELKRLALGKQYERKVLAAEGVAAENGKDGEIINHFVLGARGIPKLNVDGSVDYKELNLIHNVTKGQVLCDIVPPTDGTKGQTVKGQDIMPARGREPRLPLGRNVLVTDDGKHIYAGVDGNLTQRSNAIEIDDTFTVSGDVDNSVGNIDFIGNVVVRGDVKSGFSIKAGGSIRISGIVESAYLHAEKEITVTGVNGQGGGKLYAGTDLSASFLENATIEAKGSVSANSIMYCNIKCGGTLELKGRNACIIGGTYVVALDIIAKSIGSSSHARTELTLGSSTTLVDEMNAIRYRLKQMATDIFKLSQAITYLNAKDASTLSREKLQLLEKATYNHQILTQEKEKLAKRYEVMAEELKSPNTSKVICKGTIYTGTRITMGSSHIQLTENQNNVMVYYSDNEIMFGSA